MLCSRHYGISMATVYRMAQVGEGAKLWQPETLPSVHRRLSVLIQAPTTHILPWSQFHQTMCNNSGSKNLKTSAPKPKSTRCLCSAQHRLPRPSVMRCLDMSFNIPEVQSSSLSILSLHIRIKNVALDVRPPQGCCAEYSSRWWTSCRLSVAMKQPLVNC